MKLAETLALYPCGSTHCTMSDASAAARARDSSAPDTAARAAANRAAVDGARRAHSSRRSPSAS